MMAVARDKLPTESPQLPVPMLDVRRQNGPLHGEIDAAISEVCQAGTFVHGEACNRLEKAVAEFCGTRHAIGCASGSDALLLSLMALGIGPGDEVVLPSFTFFATAGAVWRLGARPVFADICEDTFNVDPVDIERKITPRTKAIIPVHLFGQCADMVAIGHIARQAGQLPIIEDAAQAIGAQLGDQLAGAWGTTGCFSFYPTKNLGGFGDGGMITTNSDELNQKLRTLRDHGQHPVYHHAVVGVNSRLDTVQAAVLHVKLPRVTTWSEQRSANAQRYRNLFVARGLDHWIGLPEEATGGTSVWNQYTIRVGEGRRDVLRQHLTRHNIGSAIYYPLPLHLQKCFQSLGYARGDLPVTERAAAEVLSLPIFAELREAEQDAVVAAIDAFFAEKRQPADNSAA